MPSNKKHLFSDSGGGVVPLNSGRWPLCTGDNASFGFDNVLGLGKVFQGWCPACTNVRIDEQTLDTVRRQERGHLLSAALRRLPESEWRDGRIVTTVNVDGYTSTVLELTVLDQFDTALKQICDMCPSLGERSAFNYSEDWPWLTAKRPDTALYIIRQLANLDYLEREGANPRFPPWRKLAKRWRMFSKH
jgi:hypothetical protein